jgi:hypothetical protein
MSLGELAMLLKISPPAAGYSVERGKSIARGNGYQLIEYFFTFLSWAPIHMLKIEI